MKQNTTRSQQFAKRMLQKVRLRFLAHIDVSRFSRTASFSVFDSGYEQVVSRIMYNVHALEKGLARNRELRLGFGVKALASLNDSLAVYRRNGYDRSAFAYVQGLSIIARYRELHVREGFDLIFLRGILDHEVLDPQPPAGIAGTKIVRKADKSQNEKKSFYELAQGRSSVRDFSGEPIHTDRVMDALRNAEKTPSVCNRQGWKVYWTEKPELSKQILEHQRGFGYTQLPEVLLTIVVSNNTYLSPVERNQAFVDGGLFSMSVLYGLEQEMLAAVPLNAMMYHRDQVAVRRLLEIDDSEMIIMFIAIGDFMVESIVPVSDRKSAESFVKRR